MQAMARRQPDRTPTTLGANVRWLRQKAGLSQDELAERVGISRLALLNIETGATEEPKASTIDRLAEQLGVEVDVLKNPLDEQAAREAPAPGDRITYQRFLEVAAHELADADKDDLQDMARFLDRRGLPLREWLALRDKLRTRRTLVLRGGGAGGDGRGSPPQGGGAP